MLKSTHKTQCIRTLVHALRFTELDIKHCSVWHIPASSLQFNQTQSLHMYAVDATTEAALEENEGEVGES